MNAQRFAILDQIRRVREGVDAHRHAPFAQHTMRIPMEDLRALAMFFPDLLSSDPEARAAAHDQLYNSPLSEPFRVGKVVRGVTRNGVILKHE